MLKTMILSAAVAAAGFATTETVQAATLKGRCVVTATVHGGKKFALAKCDRADFPGDYIVRLQVWEKDDAKRYRDLARLAGHRFTCDLTSDRTQRDGGMENTYFTVKNCR